MASEAAEAESVSELLSTWAAAKGDAPLFHWWKDENGKVSIAKKLTYLDVERLASGTAWRLATDRAVPKHRGAFNDAQPCS